MAAVLHQQHFSITLSIDFSAMFDENEDGITKPRYRNRDLTDLLKIEYVYIICAEDSWH